MRKGYQSLVTFAVLMIGLLASPMVMAQPATAAPATTKASDSSQTNQNLADQDLAWLIAILQDDARRTALLDQLKARNVNVAPAQQEQTEEPEAASLVEGLSQRVSNFSERALRFTASLGELLLQGKNNLQAPWLGITGFLAIAIMLSLLVFIGEAVRDAFDPRKTIG